jgi:tetratricopeptide (TPR) repeat protein
MPGIDSQMVLEDRIWLFNEIATCRLMQGNAYDAVALYRHCLRALKSQGLPATEARVRINKSVAQIDRARFDDALESLEQVDIFLDTVPFAGEIPEYREIYLMMNCSRALAHWAKGRLDLALPLINTAADKCPKELPAVQSWILGLQATLAATNGDVALAERLVKTAHAAACAAYRPDLEVCMSLLSLELQCFLAGNNELEVVENALEELLRLERRVALIGMEKLHIAIWIVRARLLLGLNQLELARKAIVSAVAASLRSGLRMKRLASLTLMVAVMASRNEKAAARELLKEVRYNANQMQFVRLIGDLQNLSDAIDEPNGVRIWAKSSLAMRAWL